VTEARDSCKVAIKPLSDEDGGGFLATIARSRRGADPGTGTALPGASLSAERQVLQSENAGFLDRRLVPGTS